MKIIDGKKIAEEIRRDIKHEITKKHIKPGLAIILIGNDPGSHVYVSLKEEAAKQVGINFKKYIFSQTVTEQEIINLINDLNNDSSIHGIVIQFPLPRGIQKEKIITIIDVNKDVDGFHPDNLKALLKGQPRLVPGLSAGIIKLIESTGEPLADKKMIVIANSKIFSEPIDFLLKQTGVEVTLCSPDEQDCQTLSSTADIIVVAVGHPNFIQGDMVKEGAIVIDVGYNRINNKAVGDVDFNSISQRAGWISPVPGGVGPMTVAMLLLNVLKAYEIQKGN